MSNIKHFLNLPPEEFNVIVNLFTTKTQIHKHFNIPYNGKGIRIVNEKINTCKSILKEKQLKYEEIKKICPTCKKEFKTLKNHEREKTTCSHSCANSYFKTGKDHPNYKSIEIATNYRTICFHYHDKKCIICGESRIVEVHHYDNNHKNDAPENLIPLCPTCHRLYHSKYVNDVLSQIEEYHKNFICGKQ